MILTKDKRSLVPAFANPQTSRALLGYLLLENDTANFAATYEIQAKRVTQCNLTCAWSVQFFTAVKPHIPCLSEQTIKKHCAVFDCAINLLDNQISRRIMFIHIRFVTPFRVKLAQINQFIHINGLRGQLPRCLRPPLKPPLLGKKFKVNNARKLLTDRAARR